MARTANIGRVSVSLLANTAQYVRNLQRAQATTRSTTDSMATTLTKFAKTAGAAIAALGLGAVALELANTAKESAKTGKELQNLATIANASTSEFAAYAAATSTVGIDMEKLGDISKDTLEKLGEYQATGAGGFKDFFEQVGNQVGVTAKSLQGLSGPEVLGRVVKAMEEANVPMEQQSFYLESIASDTTKLLPLYQNHGATINALRAEYTQLNSTLSAGTIKTFNDLDRTNETLMTNFGNAAAESLTGVIGFWDEASKAASLYFKNIADEGKVQNVRENSLDYLDAAAQFGIAGIEQYTVSLEDARQKQSDLIQSTENALVNLAAIEEEALRRGQSQASIDAQRNRLNQNLIDQKQLQTDLDFSAIEANERLLELEKEKQLATSATSLTGIGVVDPLSGINSNTGETEESNNFVFGLDTAESWLQSEEGLYYQESIFEREKLDEDYRKAKLALDEGLTSQIANLGISLNEDSSDLTKALFIGQQAAAIAQGVMNTELAATKALATDPTGAASTVARVQGYAAVGLIGAQTLGQFHDGTEEISQTGSYILKHGEAVIQPEANKDLRTFLKDPEAASGSGSTNVTQQVTINGAVTDQAWFAQELAKSADQIAGIVQKKQRQYTQR